MNIKKIYRKMALRLSRSNFWPLPVRVMLVKIGGVKCGRSFIGQEVIFDSERPENIEIGDYCAITMRCILLTHYVRPAGNSHAYEYGHIKIGNNVLSVPTLSSARP